MGGDDEDTDARRKSDSHVGPWQHARTRRAATDGFHRPSKLTFKDDAKDDEASDDDYDGLPDDLRGAEDEAHLHQSFMSIQTGYGLDSYEMGPWTRTRQLGRQTSRRSSGRMSRSTKFSTMMDTPNSQEMRGQPPNGWYGQMAPMPPWMGGMPGPGMPYPGMQPPAMMPVPEPAARSRRSSSQSNEEQYADASGADRRRNSHMSMVSLMSITTGYGDSCEMGPWYRGQQHQQQQQHTPPPTVAGRRNSHRSDKSHEAVEMAHAPAPQGSGWPGYGIPPPLPGGWAQPPVPPVYFPGIPGYGPGMPPPMMPYGPGWPSGYAVPPMMPPVMPPYVPHGQMPPPQGHARVSRGSGSAASGGRLGSGSAGGGVGPRPAESKAKSATVPAGKTTVMLRNMPESYLRDDLVAALEREGLGGVYDFVYMPMNFRTKSSFGYAFVNLVTHEDAQRCHDRFQGFTNWSVETAKVCEVSWSDMHQGLAAHIERYRNSPVMHESVPDEYKPVMFSGGVRIAFPPPTKKLRQPRVRRLIDEDQDQDGDGDIA